MKAIVADRALRTMLMMVQMTLAISLRTMMMIILNAHDPVLSPPPRRSSGPYDVNDRWGAGASYTSSAHQARPTPKGPNSVIKSARKRCEQNDAYTPKYQSPDGLSETATKPLGRLWKVWVRGHAPTEADTALTSRFEG